MEFIRCGRHYFPQNIPGLHPLNRNDITDDIAYIQVFASDNDQNQSKSKKFIQQQQESRLKLLALSEQEKHSYKLAHLTNSELLTELDSLRSDIINLKDGIGRNRREMFSLSNEKCNLELEYTDTRIEFDNCLKKVQIERNKFENNILEIREMLAKEGYLAGTAQDNLEEYRRLGAFIEQERQRNNELTTHLSEIQQRMNILEELMDKAGLPQAIQESSAQTNVLSNIDNSNEFTDNDCKNFPLKSIEFETFSIHTTTGNFDFNENSNISFEKENNSIGVEQSSTVEYNSNSMVIESSPNSQLPSIPAETPDQEQKNSDLSRDNAENTASSESNSSILLVKQNIQQLLDLLPQIFYDNNNYNDKNNMRQFFQFFSSSLLSVYVTIAGLEEKVRSKEEIIKVLSDKIESNNTEYKNNIEEKISQQKDLQSKINELLEKNENNSSSELLVAELQKQLVIQKDYILSLQSLVEISERRTNEAETSLLELANQFKTVKSGQMIITKSYKNLLKKVNELKSQNDEFKKANNKLEQTIIQQKETIERLQLLNSNIDNRFQHEVNWRMELKTKYLNFKNESMDKKDDPLNYSNLEENMSDPEKKIEAFLSHYHNQHILENAPISNNKETNEMEGKNSQKRKREN